MRCGWECRASDSNTAFDILHRVLPDSSGVLTCGTVVCRLRTVYTNARYLCCRRKKEKYPVQSSIAGKWRKPYSPLALENRLSFLFHGIIPYFPADCTRLTLLPHWQYQLSISSQPGENKYFFVLFYNRVYIIGSRIRNFSTYPLY